MFTGVSLATNSELKRENASFVFLPVFIVFNLVLLTLSGLICQYQIYKNKNKISSRNQNTYNL